MVYTTTCSQKIAIPSLNRKGFTENASQKGFSQKTLLPKGFSQNRFLFWKKAFSKYKTAFSISKPLFRISLFQLSQLFLASSIKCLSTEKSMRQ
jgi:hypothetical protein